MKYFVTGTTGFIGGEVARQLAAAGHEVIALVRSPEKAGRLKDLGLTLCPGDITDKESMRAPMTGVDGIYHIAAWYKVGVRDKSPAYRINVDGTRNVLELMRELKIPKGVYTSTIGVCAETHGQIVDETYRYDGSSFPSEYERTKWIAHYQVAEPMIREGLPLVIVMPGLVYGPGDTSNAHTMLDQYLRRRLPMVPRRTAYCWGHVEDTARGHLLAMEKGAPGESYLLTGPGHTVIEVLRLAQTITGIPAPKILVPPVLMKIGARIMSGIEKIVPVPELYAAEGLRITAGTTYLGSSQKAQRELGCTFRSLEEGLPDALAYEMKRLGMAQ